MTFWVIVFLLGLIAAPADAALNHWGKVLSLPWWIISSILWLIFMTGFGLAMRFGAGRGYSLTVAVMVVLLVNIAAVALWDMVVGGSRFTLLQWFGALLAIAAILCFELGKK